MRDELTELQLPSGATVVARRPDPILLGIWGKSLELLKAARGEPDTGGITDQQAADLAWAIGQVLNHCYVTPAISLDPKSADEIHPRGIPFEDAVYVVRWALRPEERHVAVEPRTARMRRRCRAKQGRF